LLFRVCDFKQTQSINTKVRAFLFETNSSEEGESDGKVQQRLTLENNGRILLYIPTTICHFINSKSPLYNMTPMQLADSNFEIVLSMTGISEKTGLTSQVCFWIILIFFKTNQDQFLVAYFLSTA
jgi:hypothetical protein